MGKTKLTESHTKAGAGPGLWREDRPNGNGILFSREVRTNGDRARRDRDFDHAAVGAFEATLSGHITEANSALVKLLGFDSREDLVGSCISELLADPATLDRVLGHGRAGHDLRGVEVPLRTKQGEEVVVLLLSTRLMESVGGRGRRVVGTLMDITERRRSESDLEPLAIEDPENGVANRRAVEVHTPKYLAAAVRRGTLLWGESGST